MPEFETLLLLLAGRDASINVAGCNPAFGRNAGIAGLNDYRLQINLRISQCGKIPRIVMLEYACPKAFTRASRSYDNRSVRIECECMLTWRKDFTHSRAVGARRIMIGG
ncbi:hypothetical protein WK93_04435 [Burkholderia ubonensis]|nr:hypothetical protein WK93_04435 [Burkholderia ubonensis]